MKIQKLIFIIVIIVLIILVVLLFIPINGTVKLPLSDNILNTESDDTRILICRLLETTGPSWEIIGDNAGLYSSNSEKELIIAEGNSPELKVNNNLLINSSNIFILIGEFIGEEEEFGPPGENYRVFDIKNWDIVYPIDRGDSLREFVSKKYLTVYDYKWF